MISFCANPTGPECFAKYKKDLNFRVDRGSLGDFSNSEARALIAETLSVWSDVPTADINFIEETTPLDADIDGANFVGIIQSDAELDYSPVVFDNDGSIIASLFGDRAKNFVLGFAGPIEIDEDEQETLRSEAVINGRFFKTRLTGSSRASLAEKFQATFLHEAGHMLGIDHSQTHVDALLANDVDSLPDFTNDELREAAPVMFPIALTSKRELTRDDISAISGIYPAGNVRNLGEIRGRVVTKSNTGLLGVNVTAYNIDDPLNIAVSSVSDIEARGTGEFIIPALPNGSYVLRVQKIPKQFRDGSQVGPYNSNEQELQEGYYAPGSDLLASFSEAINNPESLIVINTATKVDGIVIKDIGVEDDYGNNIETAYPILNALSNGDIETGGDRDVFEVRISASSQLNVTTTGRAKTTLALLDPDSKIIQFANYDRFISGATIERDLAPGTYYVSVSGESLNDVGNYSLKASFPGVNQAPRAIFVPDSFRVPQNVPLLFNASLSVDPDGTITSYEWDFDNDGEIDLRTTEPIISHSFSEPGLKTVTLKVTDNRAAFVFSQRDVVVRTSNFGSTGSSDDDIIQTAGFGGDALDLPFVVEGLADADFTKLKRRAKTRVRFSIGRRDFSSMVISVLTDSKFIDDIDFNPQTIFFDGSVVTQDVKLIIPKSRKFRRKHADEAVDGIIEIPVIIKELISGKESQFTARIAL